MKLINRQCESCIHGDVCTYKEHYKDAVDLYETAKNECEKYPYFICDIKCVKYLTKAEPQKETGHWIEVNTNEYVCSKCGHSFSIIPEDNSIKQYKCCPNCECRMVDSLKQGQSESEENNGND